MSYGDRANYAQQAMREVTAEQCEPVRGPRRVESAVEQAQNLAQFAAELAETFRANLDRLVAAPPTNTLPGPEKSQGLYGKDEPPIFPMLSRLDQAHTLLRAELEKFHQQLQRLESL